METPEEADAAVAALHGAELGGKSINVEKVCSPFSSPAPLTVADVTHYRPAADARARRRRGGTMGHRRGGIVSLLFSFLLSPFLLGRRVEEKVTLAGSKSSLRHCSLAVRGMGRGASCTFAGSKLEEGEAMGADQWTWRLDQRDFLFWKSRFSCALVLSCGSLYVLPPYLSHTLPYPPRLPSLPLTHSPPPVFGYGRRC
jgi:hypothetical protein